MKTLLLIAALLLTGCAGTNLGFMGRVPNKLGTLTAKCRHIVWAQYLAAKEDYPDATITIVVGHNERNESHAWLSIVTADGRQWYVDNYWMHQGIYDRLQRGGNWTTDEIISVDGKMSANDALNGLDRMPMTVAQGAKKEADAWNDYVQSERKAGRPVLPAWMK